ncbi:hypothetical protein, partial [Bordetella trematum]
GGDTSINTGAGVDVITLVDSQLLGQLLIAAGDGSNTVDLTRVSVAKATRITTGKDDDRITLLETDIGGSLDILAGEGDNVIDLTVVTVGGATQITSGAGNDSVTLLQTDIGGSLDIDAGDGANTVSLDTVTVGAGAGIRTGNGDDTIMVVDSAIVGQLLIEAGEGDNLVQMTRVTIGGDTRILSGAGDDRILLRDVAGQGSLSIDAGHGDNELLLWHTFQGGATTLRTGQGNDLITLDQADLLGHLSIDAGAGDDKIWMSQILLGAGALVDTGAGNDYVYLSARALAGGISIQGRSGNNLIVLDQLPSLTSQQTVAGQNDRVDVDGGSGSSHVIVNLNAAPTDILINVRNTDGQGRDNLWGGNRLTVNGSTEDETFLLRANFLAKLTPQGTGYAEQVQRVNYDRSLTGGMRINAVDGGNRFFIDDTGTHVTIDGGAGSDPSKRNEYQVGQLFAQDRRFPNVALGDEIDTIRTTQGYLSRGNSFDLAIYGAENSSNVFRVYSNAAPLALYGGKRDDEFLVFAFQTHEAQPDGKPGYVLNGPLSMDGGGGANTFTMLGSEGDDAFVLTQEGIRGAGLNTLYQNMQKVNLDAREGNDHIYVLSTRSNVITTLIGGGGSNTFDLSGDVADNTIVSGREGSRDVFDGKQPVVITAQPGTLQGGNTVVLDVSLDPSVLPRPGSGQAYVSLTSAMLAAALYGSLTQGTGLSAADDLAAALQSLQGRGLLLSTDGGLTWHDSAVLAFDATGAGAQSWDTSRQVLVKLEEGAGLGLPPLDLAGRDLRLSASLFTTLPGLQDVALRPIVVSVGGQAAPGAGAGQSVTPRVTDQPVIRVDAVTGVSYANYPDQPHDLSAIQGGLLIEGGTLDTPDYDASLRAGIGLPGETDGELGPRDTGVAPTEPVNNRVRLFDDGATTGKTGMQDQAEQLDGLARLYHQPQAGEFGRITGLGMTPGVGQAGGQVTMSTAQGSFSHDRGVVFHGIQSVNTMLGQGDDTFTVRHAPVGTVTLVQGGGGNNRLVAEGSTVGGTQRPVLLFASTSQDDRYYTATSGQRQAGQALAFGPAGRSVLDARGATEGVILYGGAGDAVIYGGSGNDLIAGGGGSNVIHAGQGNNIVFGNAGINIDLGAPMDMAAGAGADVSTLHALTLVLSPEQAAGLAVGASADLLQAGANTITAGDGNNIVFANFGRIVTVSPVNYLRNRGDFIDPAAADGASVRYLSGAGLLSLENLPLRGTGSNQVTVGNGRNVVFGGLGDDVLQAGEGYNLLAGDGAQALYDGSGHIASFGSTFPSEGGDNQLYNAGHGVMLGGLGNNVLESGAGTNVMFGAHGRVSFVADRFSVIESQFIEHGGDTVLLAGSGSNFMLGGPGRSMLRGNLSKDVMVGDYAAIYLDPWSGRIKNLVRFGMGGNTPDLIARTMELLYSRSATLGQLPHPVFEREADTRVVLAGSPVAVSLAATRPDIVLARDGQALSDYAAGTDDPLAMAAGLDAAASGQSQAVPVAGQVEPVQAAVPPAQDVQDEPVTADPPADGQAEAAPSGEPDAPQAATSPSERLAQAAGVGVLGLSAALGAGGSVVFNARTQSWEPRSRRKSGLRVTRKQDEQQGEAAAVSEDE